MDFTADDRFLVYDALNEITLADASVARSYSIFALDVADAFRVFETATAFDPADSWSRPFPAPVRSGLPKGLRLGVPHNEFLSMMEPEVGAAVQDALGVLKQHGATLVDVRFPPLAPVVGAHRAIIFSEAAAAHEELIRTRAGEVQDELHLLTYLQTVTGARFTAISYWRPYQVPQRRRPSRRAGRSRAARSSR